MKIIFITTFLILTSTITYGQTNLLIKNVNLRAKELKHDLNASKDTLVLEASRTIHKLEIYNHSFSKHIEVENKMVNVPLNQLPLGKLIVEVVLKDKRIILTIIRQSEGDELTEIAEAESFIDTENTTEPSNVIDLSEREAPKPEKSVKSYWVEYIISNGNSSYKTLRFASKTLVDKMVAKNKLEVKSVKGKLNKLTIWEVYDTTRFLRFKRINPNFSSAVESPFFNTTPYYDSEIFLASL
ncbi:hypothetical protein [uncultured Winogradskyella sp.]|uniref:hypothetical protein n=1 Tax=uncultured Winogradskyella sp. TaxID=395353 RepID=UPI0035149A7D